VTNAIQLSLFMVSLSQRLLLEFRKESPQAGVLDLRTYFRGRYYASETLKMLPQKPEPILFQRITHFIASLGSIHSPYQRAKAA
jgi:putative transposase